MYKIPRIMYVVTGACALALIGFFALCLLFPSLFWERFIWQYIWGPVVADAWGMPIDGATEGYNVFNTIIYGLVMGLFLFWIYALLRKLRIDMDWKFVLVMMPFVVVGGALRALEDSGLFNPPVSYLFISPLIYLTLATVVIAGLLLTWLLSKRISGIKIMRYTISPILFLSLAILGIVVLLVISRSERMLEPFSILFAALVAYLVGHLPFLRDDDGRHGYRAVTAANGIFLLLICSLYILMWMSTPWQADITTYPKEIGIIIALAATVTVAVFSVLNFASAKYSVLKHYVIPSSLLILGGHMLDAAATYRGIAAYGYIEKHVVPKLLIDITGTSLVMFPFKLGIVMLVLYILEDQVRQEIKDATLMGLLRFAVLILGLSPGIRSMLRIAMGV